MNDHTDYQNKTASADLFKNLGMRQIRQMKHEIFIANTNQTFHKVNLQSDPPTPNINPWSPKQIYCSSLKST